MARDLNQMRSVIKSNEDVGAVFMKKLAEEKKISDEARALYNNLCANVEKSKTELTAIKMECFNLESFLQESQIRLKVYEKLERDLRDEDERVKVAIKEAENHQREELAARDSHNKAFIKKVVELAEDYSRFKSNCDRKKLADSYDDFKVADEQLSREIKEVMAEMAIEKCENFVPLVSADSGDEHTLQDIRDLKKYLEYDIQCAETTNANLQAQTDQLSVLKTALQKEIESLKEILKK